MDTPQLVFVALAVAVVAFLFSSVGHAGASGYIAVMTLFGFAATVVKPTALVLNIIVASIGTVQFWRAGHFSWFCFGRLRYSPCQRLFSVAICGRHLWFSSGWSVFGLPRPTHAPPASAAAGAADGD